jgi:hypothetical protein
VPTPAIRPPFLGRAFLPAALDTDQQADRESYAEAVDDALFFAHR